MNLEEALSIVDNLVQPQRLSTLQETIFRECWEGKTYQQIAENSDYDADYVRVVGSRLWQIISEACNEKVTKNNFRSILRQQSHKNVPQNTILELPDRPVAHNSNFYIERPPIEEICLKEIAKPGSLVRIKAAKNMGKKSLIRRILSNKNSEYHTVVLNLQQADRSILNDFGKLLRWFLANIGFSLNIENLINNYWDEDLGIKVSSTSYLQNHILEQIDKPLILVLDKLHLIFEHTATAREFLPLLRFWHEESNNIAAWQKLRLIVIQSTENYVPLNFNQSPFNVGVPVTLPEFNREQMLDLAERHQLEWRQNSGTAKLTQLMNLIGGHPYLARLAFYHLAQYNLDLSTLIQESITETGIYSNILRNYLVTLYNNPEIAKSFRKVVTSENRVQLEPITAYKLESLGLIKLIGNEAVVSCNLYYLYFQERLNQI